MPVPETVIVLLPACSSNSGIVHVPAFSVLVNESPETDYDSVVWAVVVTVGTTGMKSLSRTIEAFPVTDCTVSLT